MIDNTKGACYYHINKTNTTDNTQGNAFLEHITGNLLTLIDMEVGPLE